MKKEYIILSHLTQETDTTQRSIAYHTGISVGGVNMLLKKMIKKGLIKVENINAKSLRYNLTPKGMKEKLELTYKFTRSSYQKIAKISLAFKDLVDRRRQEAPQEEIILYGPPDEVQQILKISLAEMNVPYRKVNPEDEGYSGQGLDSMQSSNILEGMDSQERPDNPKSLVVVWRVEDEEELPLTGFMGRTENILKYVDL